MLLVAMIIWGLLLLDVVFLVACMWKTLRRSLHMYQQCAYQNPSYRKWLRENRRELFAPTRLVPLALCFAAITLSSTWSLPLCIVGALLFLVLNRPIAAKKPLVYTPRVMRLIATAGVFALLLSGLAVWLWVDKGPWLFSTLAAALLCGLVLLEPWLVMVYAAVNGPMERAVNRRYIEEARGILAAHPGLTVIGITGSYGKTSTKHFLNELLSVKYNVYITPGNYNTTLGVVRAVREGLRPTHEIFLCEMGARHPGDIAEICDLVQPQMGVLTYIGAQHLETFGSQQAIIDTKLELPRAVFARGGRMFVNFSSELAARQHYTGDLTRYGTHEAADYRCTDAEIGSKGSAFTVTAPSGESGQFSTRLLGEANVQNITAAIAVAHSLGIPFDRLRPAVRGLKSVPHRLELKPAGAMTLIDDAYNSNPEGARVALDTLALCSGSRVCITPGIIELGEREAECNRALGAQAAHCADYLVVVGQSPGGHILAGARAAGMAEQKLHHAASFTDAMAHVKALGLPDMFVLLLNDLTDNYS